ncbi:hypothetical protein [Methylobacterium sp. Leaf88]|uniref:hypothetical protein n=1 Tax=Methylobacterium sp. Leaf88 TaxID=1736244 RepID=UPI000AC8D8F5|nr:hypothetical protein [Methylobacterium sp. Leaf88]
MKLLQIAELPPHSAGTVRILIQGAAFCTGFPSPADDFLEGSLDRAPRPRAQGAADVSDGRL